MTGGEFHAACLSRYQLHVKINAYVTSLLQTEQRRHEPIYQH